MAVQLREKRDAKGLWGLCPVRCIIALLSLLVIGLYFALRGNAGLMAAYCERAAEPCHVFMAELCSGVRFSVAELIYVLVVLAALVYIIIQLVLLFRRGERLRRLCKTLVTLLCVALVFYAGYCALWGVLYYGESFSEKLGLEAEPVSTEQLETVTAYFAALAGEYGDVVERDGDGLYTASRDDILDRSAAIYRAAARTYPVLDGPELRPKPFALSKLLSYMNFTGFFFPFTGEANLNVDSPVSMLPSTAAHELAHQRGVAAEQEANFVAVMASMESGDADFCYSASLLAYIHLGNALLSVDSEAYRAISSGLSDGVRADLRAHSAYWDGFRTKVAEASEAVYTGFLRSNGQTLGMKSYGACIDLLIAYYYDEAVREGF